RFHDRLTADDDEKPPARAQHADEMLVELRNRARYRDHVELAGVREGHCVRRLNVRLDRQPRKLLTRALDEIRVVVDAQHAIGKPGEARGEIAAAGADLEHTV